jgi:hypothetical protein
MTQRIAANEAAFRDINEAIERGQWPGETDAVAFRCECARLGCNQLIELSIPEYKRIREHSRWFFVARGHEEPQAEVVVETRDAYLVVEKLGQAGEVAERTDPGA